MRSLLLRLAIVPILLACAQPGSAQDEAWTDRFIAGHRALEVGDLGGAGSAFQAALQLEPKHAATAWGLACTAAREERIDTAFEWLDHVAEWSGAERALLDWDPDLASLRVDPRFVRLAAEWGSAQETDPRRTRWGLASQGDGRGTSMRAFAIGRSDRESIWIAANDGSIREVDGRTGRSLKVEMISSYPLVAIAGGPNGKTICAREEDGTTHLVNATTLKLIQVYQRELGGSKRYSLMKYSLDERFLAVSFGTGRVALIDVPSGRVLWQNREVERAQGLIWSGDSSHLLLKKSPSELLRVSIQEGAANEIIFAVPGEIGTFGFIPGTQRCLVATRNSRVLEFDAATGEMLREQSVAKIDGFGEPVRFGSMDFDSTGSLAVLGSAGIAQVVMIDLVHWELLWNFSYNGGNAGAVRVAFSEDDLQVHAGSYRTAYAPRVVDARTGRAASKVAGSYPGAKPLPVGAGLFASKTPDGLEVRHRDGDERYLRVEGGCEGWLLVSPCGRFDGDLQTIVELRAELSGREHPLIELATSLLDPKRVRAAAEGIQLRSAVIR